MLFKDISYLELWRPFCSAEQNHLCNFGRGFYEEQFCGIILNLDQWFKRCHLKIFVYQELWQPFCSAEWNHLCNFGRRHHEEEFCEIILNLDQWFKRSPLNVFLIWSSGGRFVQPNIPLNHLCNFGRGHYVEQFCEIILNLGQWFRCCLKDVIWSSGSPPAEPFMQL